jgi:hypothetical protein
MKIEIRPLSLFVILIAATVRAGIELPDAPPVKVRAQTIDDQIKIGYGLAIADVDGDGKDDILLVDQHEVVWYQNPTWTKHRMTGQLTARDHVCIAARDIDNDGRAEVAVGGEWDPGDTQNSGAVFYLMPPADRTQEWEPIRLQSEPTVHRMHWVRDQDDHFFLAVLPLHGRGNQNGEGAGVRFMGYRRPPDPRGVWETFLLNDELHVTHNFEPVRWDGIDPGEEMLVASKEGLMVVSWETNHWYTQQVTTNAAGEARSGKLPSGRRMLASIEPFHGNEVVVNSPVSLLLGRISWTRHRVVLDDSLVGGHALATGDLLGQGWDEVVVGWRGSIPPREDEKVGIKVFVPTDKRGYGWKLNSVIDDNHMACEDLKLADLNKDGKLDIIACGRATHNVVIYWNETPPWKP